MADIINPPIASGALVPAAAPAAPVTPPPNTVQITTALQPLAADALQAEKEIVALIAAYRAKGASGAAALLPSLAPELQKDWGDVQAALPVIKAGYKTSEFWIVAGVCLGLGIMTALGKVPSVDGATIIGALTGIYAMVRGLIKKPSA